MKYQEALSLLRFKKKKKFALVGNENYLKENFIKAAEKVYSDFDLKVMFPEDQNEVLSLLRCDSLLGEDLIVLNYFDKMKIELFEDTIGSYDGCVVLLLSEKANLKSRSMTKILSDVVMTECRKLREYGTDYLLWIRSQVLEYGYEAPDLVDKIIYSRIGPNMYTIAHELNKLFILRSEEKKISIKDVEDYVSITATSTAFDLFENLIRRNICKAYHCFESYSKGHDNFFEIIVFLGVYFEKMYRILLFREKKFDIGDIADIVGIPQFLVRTRYLPWALAFGKNEIASKIGDICNLNVQLRLFKGNKKIIFERFITNFSK